MPEMKAMEFTDKLNLQPVTRPVPESDKPVLGQRLERLTLQARTRHREVTDEAIVVTDQAAGTAGVKLVERPEPQAAITTSLFDSCVGIHRE